jgi:hypothetical protein
MKLTVLLATCFDVTAQTIHQLIPKNSQFIQYGWVYQLEGGDVMHACELNPPQSDSHDMSLSGYVLMYLIWYTLTYFYFSISFWLIDLLISNAKHLSLNCMTSLAKSFAFLSSAMSLL